MSAEQNLRTRGIALPPAPNPQANYVTSVIAGHLLYVSGQGPRDATGHLHLGKVGAGVDVDTAYDHARLCGLNLIALARQALGSLDRVRRVVKLLGMVNATHEFIDHPRVINGCSDLMVEVFGEAGRHARSAVGMGGLPNGMTVEIEAIFEIEPQ